MPDTPCSAHEKVSCAIITNGPPCSAADDATLMSRAESFDLNRKSPPRCFASGSARAGVSERRAQQPTSEGVACGAVSEHGRRAAARARLDLWGTSSHKGRC
jgi:hypothetical protein